MRVTTQMNNQIAEQTKIGVNRNSLLNAGDSSTGNTLLDELNKTSEEKTSTIMDGNYKKIAKSADALEQAAALFMETGEGSLLAKLDTEEGRKKAAGQLGTLVEKYNEMLSALGKSKDELNIYYAQMVKELAGSNKSALEAVGITVGSDSKLAFDQEKFAKAGAEDITKAVGAQSDFMQKLAYISEHIADNANTNAESIASRYNAAGTSFISVPGAGLFDTMG